MRLALSWTELGRQKQTILSEIQLLVFEMCTKIVISGDLYGYGAKVAETTAAKSPQFTNVLHSLWI